MRNGTPSLRSLTTASTSAGPSVPAIGPGTMELMRMPCGPHSSASTCVSMSTPAFAAL